MKKWLFALVALLFSALAFATVNINTATQEELDALKGIGPVKAKAIVDYRSKNGSFKSVEDIKKVKGIGDKTFDAIKGDISVSGATTSPTTEAKKSTNNKSAKPESKPEAAPAKEDKKSDKAAAKDEKKSNKSAKESKNSEQPSKDDKKSSKKEQKKSDKTDDKK